MEKYTRDVSSRYEVYSLDGVKLPVDKIIERFQPTACGYISYFKYTYRKGFKPLFDMLEGVNIYDKEKQEYVQLGGE